MGALGAQLAGSLPGLAASRWKVEPLSADQAAFVGYALLALVIGFVYARLPPDDGARRGAGLEASRHLAPDRIQARGALHRRLLRWRRCRSVASRALALPQVRTVDPNDRRHLLVAGLLAAFSQLASSRLAVRIGRVRTMVYTHLPANVFLILAGVMPTAERAVAFLLARMALSQMDVPASDPLPTAPTRRAAGSMPQGADRVAPKLTVIL
jgi:hypothetical protein